MVVKMRKNKSSYYSKFVFFLGASTLLFLGFIEGDKRGNGNERTYSLQKTQESGKQGDAYRFFINNIDMPMNRVGTMADVNIQPGGSEANFGNGSFLFSGGFFLSGYTEGNLWAFAQASASLVENMTPGTVASGPNDPDAVLYVVNSEDVPFGQSWQDWKTAVDKFDADFYDGNGDGEYNPVDLNGNGEWDPDEDMPDLLGDETVWCVYNDGQPGAQRTRFAGINPQGVEIRQTVFGFASKGALGNMMFIRYRIKNTGLVADVLDSVIFGAWADPDLGETFQDDLVGVDVPRNAGFTYNGGEDPDPAYGTQIPCFIIDFFSGPIAYIAGETFVDNDGDGLYTESIDTPIDTGYSFRGQRLGIREYPGAKNLDVSSFVHYIQSDPLRGDPNDENEARHYMSGRLKLGEMIDPCDDPVNGRIAGGVDCSTIDPLFWYSGDPVTDVGWLNANPTDQRQMTNVGPFRLVRDEELEIVVAYVVGQGSDRLNSITVARGIDDGAQFIFDGNFRAPSPPPSLQVEVQSGPDFIDFIMPVYKQFEFWDQTDAWDNRFEGINVTAFRTNSTQATVSGQQNSKLYTSYQVDNFIEDLYKENSETGGIELLYSASTNRLDLQTYTDPDLGKIRVRITRDPFTDGPLVKGKPYYFSFTSYAINFDALRPIENNTQFGDVGDYYLSAEGFVTDAENTPKIVTAVLGDDLYNPPIAQGSSTQISGASQGQLVYDPITKSALTGDMYEVTFYPDSSTELYSTFWKLENINTNTVILDSSKEYTFGTEYIGQKETEGFIVRISDEVAAADTDLTYMFGDMWVDSLNSVFHYLSTDIEQSSKLKNIGGNLSNLTGTYVTADRLRRVEIRFGETQKAYRYLNGFYGANNTQQKRFFKYAEAVTSADTIGKGPVGMWDEQNDRAMGYIDVPFQVWVDDPQYQESRQLAIGIIEKRADLGGNPDGIWDPGNLLLASGEYILIFDEDYDPEGNHKLYKGGPYIDPNAGYADLNGAGVSNGIFYPIPDEANLTQDERNIVESPFFNTLYAVGIQKATPGSTFMSGDRIVIGVDTYPYTTADVFQFQTSEGGALTYEQEKELFNSVNVFPNPLYGFNVATSYTNSSSDEPFVTFSNLPDEVTIKIYSLSGQLLRTLTQPANPTPFLSWDLLNESGLRVASGLYLAIVSSPKYGDKVLKFSIIMPQKQIQKY